PLSYGIAGNSRYLFEILKIMIRIDSPFDFYLYSNKEIHPAFKEITSSALAKTFVSRKKNLLGFIWLNFELPQTLRDDRIDVFWGTLQMLPFRKLNIPEVVNYHDLNFISAPDTMTRLNFLQHRILSPRTLKVADRIFCLSENTMNDIRKFRPGISKKLRVIYPGVTKKSSTVEIGGRLRKKYFFTVGTLEPRKNLRTIITAYLDLKKELPDFPIDLIVAGRLGWGEDELTEKLRKKEFEKDGLLFFENPSDEILSLLFADCSAFLFPSVHEGFGLPLLEALAENKICAASDIPVFHEILDPEEDLFISPLDSASWKNAMILLTKKNVEKRAVPFDFSKWSWSETARKIEEELLNLWKKKLEKKLRDKTVV
ncbi:MAG: glycosyltransferase family 4 protein, partial [Leptospira sp.]|nr:glycosyltransferase family 4 protein [Leptospira sp.]